ncbi:isoform 3 of ankyrin-3 [Aspergillus udagawae]|nr:isoform 3 of ankyrin-3 [Aspergillus udagawae]
MDFRADPRAYVPEAQFPQKRTSVYPAVQEVGVQKNLTDEDWKFVAHRREKRKREGKDAGDVRVHGNLIPEPKVRKETARHASLLSQCLSLGDSDPKTPEGVVVGTPRSEIDGTVSDDSANVLAMDWCQGLSVDSINVGSPTLFQSAERDHRLSVSTSASTSNLLASVAAVGDVEICRILIEAGADLNASSGPTGWRTTALHRASENNNVECVRVLLEAGADPNPAVDGRHHYTLHALGTNDLILWTFCFSLELMSIRRKTVPDSRLCNLLSRMESPTWCNPFLITKRTRTLSQTPRVVHLCKWNAVTLTMPK